MNIRLDIASRVLLAGMLARPSSIILPDDKLAESAMNLADALIAAEEQTRKPDENPMTEPDIRDRIESLRSNVWGMMGDNESRITQLNKIVRSLDAILEDARRKA